ncbi:MAG: hypothetical protein O9248_00015 [Rhodobacteraceae bacterium]|nr:hypothetical protein [Paracoccaceae bacterium]
MKETASRTTVPCTTRHQIGSLGGTSIARRLPLCAVGRKILLQPTGRYKTTPA